MDLLGDIDTYRDRHPHAPFDELTEVQPFPPTLPYKAIESQSLISSQEEAAGRAAERTRPSTATA
jgi:hypothetical protein